MSSVAGPEMLKGTWGTAGFDRCLARVRGRTVIDAGANSGFFTQMFLDAGAARVIAIEPGPKLAQGLRVKFASEPRVVVVQVGLAEAQGRLIGVRFHNCWTLARPGELAGKRAGAISPEAAGIEGDQPFDVELRTLDMIVDEFRAWEDLALVKMDVDGYEFRALKGAVGVLERIRPPMHFELSYIPAELGDSIEDMLQFIVKHRYVFEQIDGVRIFSPAEVLAHFPWHTSFDMLLVPVGP